jgi:hypothetical protein
MRHEEGSSAMNDTTRVIEIPQESFSRRENREGAQLPSVQGNSATPLLQAIERAASNPTTDMDKMERLFRMHQEIAATQAKAAWNVAMARAQANIEPVLKNAVNTHTKSRYAKLDAINKMAVPLYTAEGLSISFDNEECPTPGFIRTIALVAHAAGHTQKYHIDLPPDEVGSKGNANKTAVQAIGSTSSYACRYLVCRIFNVATTDDDDGNGGAEDSDSKGLTEDEYQGFAKAIQSQVTKEKAKEEWQKALNVCAEREDVESAEKLKTVLMEHAKFIDNANRQSAQ